MKRDAFSGFHPAVNFIFFISVMGFAVVILHPVFLAVGILGAAAYFFLLSGRKGLKQLLWMVPLLLAVALLNPLLNRNGQTVLFYVGSRPYTREALVYGMALSGMLLAMLLWVSCYGIVMTGDKFTSLFGNLLPSLSLLLVMVFRMVPGLIRKGRQITGARRSVGKELKNTAEAVSVLSCLTTWALEGSIVTADSMRSRGYGSAKRTSFMIYRMTRRDWVVLGVILGLTAGMIAAAAAGEITATFTPTWYIAPCSPVSLVLYGGLSFLPSLLHLLEALVWHISRSRI